MSSIVFQVGVSQFGRIRATMEDGHGGRDDEVTITIRIRASKARSVVNWNEYLLAMVSAVDANSQ
jgi:hypothetical protein